MKLKSQERCSAYLIFVVIVAAFSGILYGYHTGIISGALIFLVPTFQLSIIDQSMLVSMVIFGGLFGALFAGVLADRIGRRRTIAMTSTLFIGGAVIIALSNSYEILLIGRFISGIGVGIISLAAPLYLAEVSPPHFRRLFCRLISGLHHIWHPAELWDELLLCRERRLALDVRDRDFPRRISNARPFLFAGNPRMAFQSRQQNTRRRDHAVICKDKSWMKQIEEMQAVDKPGSSPMERPLFSQIAFHPRCGVYFERPAANHRHQRCGLLCS